METAKARTELQFVHGLRAGRFGRRQSERRTDHNE